MISYYRFYSNISGKSLVFWKTSQKTVFWPKKVFCVHLVRRKSTFSRKDFFSSFMEKWKMKMWKSVFHGKLFRRKTVFHAFSRNQMPYWFACTWIVTILCAAVIRCLNCLLFSSFRLLFLKKPSEFNTYYDIEAVYDCLKKNYGIRQEDLILYGQSVGSGPTLHLAARLQRLRGVVLHSAILSGIRVLYPVKVTFWFDIFKVSLSQLVTI